MLLPNNLLRRLRVTLLSERNNSVAPVYIYIPTYHVRCSKMQKKSILLDYRPKKQVEFKTTPINFYNDLHPF